MSHRTFQWCTYFTFVVEHCAWFAEPKKKAAYIGDPLQTFEIFYKDGDLFTLWRVEGALWADVSGCVFTSHEIRSLLRDKLMVELPQASNLLPPPKRSTT